MKGTATLNGKLDPLKAAAVQTLLLTFSDFAVLAEWADWPRRKGQYQPCVIGHDHRRGNLSVELVSLG